MARPITYAIRVTLVEGRTVFVRRGGIFGRGPIASYPTREQAEAKAESVRRREYGIRDVAVIERSHGRQWPAASEAQSVGSEADTVSDGESKERKLGTPTSVDPTE